MKFIIFCILAVSLTGVASLSNEETDVLPQGRIKNGRTAKKNQFLYTVALALKADPKRSSNRKCTGSLISHEWVLTAAHCVYDMKLGNVSLGATNIRHPELKYHVSSENFIVHPDFNTSNTQNDIALIKIPFTNYTTNIKPVRLPSFASINNTYSNETAKISGWGRTNNYSRKGIYHLQWAKFKVIENSLCEQTYGPPLTTNICVATGKGTSPCSGDSGAPLVLKSPKIQIGVMSFSGDLKCRAGKPAVFTRITVFLDWIKQHTGISY